MIRMEVRGAKELIAKFKELKLDMARSLAAALIAGANPIVNATKQNAPIKTGNLMRSYHIGTDTMNITDPQSTNGAPQPVKLGAVAAVAEKLEQGRTAEVMVGTDVVYAPPQEFLYKPHLRPALEANRNEVQAEVKRAIESMIKRAERGL